MSADTGKSQARLRIDLEDREDFDARFGTDTTLPANVRYRGDNADQAVPCTPSFAPTVRVILDRVPIEPSDYTFIDIGAGKGRALLVAAERPFARIIGVELSRELCAIARQNVERAGRRDIEVVCADAAGYDPPVGNTLVYLYQPFHRRVMRSVVERIDAAAAVAGTDVWLAYLCPSYHGVIMESGAWHVVHHEAARAHSNGFEEHPWTIYRRRPAQPL